MLNYSISGASVHKSYIPESISHPNPDLFNLQDDNHYLHFKLVLKVVLALTQVLSSQLLVWEFQKHKLFNEPILHCNSSVNY